jgi:hypothetical protein
MWILIILPEYEYDRENGETEGIVVPVVVSVRLALEKGLLVSPLLVSSEEEPGDKCVGEQLPELIQRPEEAEGDLLQEQDDEEISSLDDVKVLKELSGARDLRDKNLVETRTCRDGQPRHNQHVYEEVKEGPVQNAGMIR